jgi:hypothetical protein
MIIRCPKCGQIEDSVTREVLSKNDVDKNRCDFPIEQWESIFHPVGMLSPYFAMPTA